MLPVFGRPRWHFMTVNYRPAKGVPASLDRAGPPRLRSRHGRICGDAEEKSDFKLDETAVNSWAYELINDNNLPEAIILLKLNVQSYPDSGNAYDSLGEAYMKAGQKQLAIEN